MIKIKYKVDNDIIKNIIMTGHAMYDVFGKDIVCASVSSLVIYSINLCISFDSQSIIYKNDNGIVIEHINDDNITQKILKTMIISLKELADDYPKNITIRKEEI